MSDPTHSEEPAGGRVTGLSVVAVYATDLSRSLAFYVDLLGLERADDMPPGLLLRAGEALLYLEGGRRETADVGLFRATTSVCFATDSVRRAFERLEAAGVPLVEPYRELAPAFAMFRVSDPDGNVIEFAGTP